MYHDESVFKSVEKLVRINKYMGGLWDEELMEEYLGDMHYVKALVDFAQERVREDLRKFTLERSDGEPTFEKELAELLRIASGVKWNHKVILHMCFC